MRGVIAAACASLLVGLANPAVLVCPRFASPDCAAAAESARLAQTGARPAAQGSASQADRQRGFRPAGCASQPVAHAATPAPWLTPSGPAPSRAPPAVRAA